MNEFQHPDSIWTWDSSARSRRASLWVPYLQTIKKAKSGWEVAYNGGEFVVDLRKTEAILFYGSSGDLPLAFLDDLAAHRVVMLIHRRNLADPYVFYPAARRDDIDLLTAQITARENFIRAAYVARTLVRERFKATRYPVKEGFYQQLSKLRKIEEVRNAEALQSRQYWGRFFSELGLEGETRRGKNPVSAALDACSFFLYGVLLRWVLMHKLSPAHGYLHVTTGYPSLVYDLMEPYRYILEDVVQKIYLTQPKDLTAACLSELKFALETEVFVPSHRVVVRRKNLLHGAVLSLRAWLLKQTDRLVFPTEGQRIGGRKPKVGYRLPGADSQKKAPG